MQQKTKPSQINQIKPVLLTNSPHHPSNKVETFRITIMCSKHLFIKLFSSSFFESGRSIRRLLKSKKIILPKGIVLPTAQKIKRICKRCGNSFVPIKNQTRNICESCSKKFSQNKKQQGVTK